MSTHETMGRDEEVQGSSNRNFGLVFAALFLILAFVPDSDGDYMLSWLGAFSFIFLAAALMAPDLLGPLNVLWTRFGMLLHKVMSPVILGFMFFGVVMPTGILKRIFGGDGLGLTFDKKAESYWIERDPPGPAPDSMKHQF